MKRPTKKNMQELTQRIVELEQKLRTADDAAGYWKKLMLRSLEVLFSTEEAFAAKKQQLMRDVVEQLLREMPDFWTGKVGTWMGFRFIKNNWVQLKDKK